LKLEPIKTYSPDLIKLEIRTALITAKYYISITARTCSKLVIWAALFCS